MQNKEISTRTHEASQKRNKHLKLSPEHHNRQEAHSHAEKARHKTTPVLDQSKEKRAHQANRHNNTSQEDTYRLTLAQVQKELPRSTRSFSRFIHTPNIEKLSDMLATTIARPNAILAGSISAFALVLAVYSYAKYTGFSLQGSETMIAFAIGWSIGIIFDFFRQMFTKA